LTAAFECNVFKNQNCGGVQMFTPVIPATREAEIGRITAQGQPGGNKVNETPISINSLGVVAYTILLAKKEA
jgi:hypothetical protein